MDAVLINNAHSHVKHTDTHQVNFAAIVPAATNPGSTAGTTTGHINQTIVPPKTAKNATVAIPPNTIIRFPMNFTNIIFRLILLFISVQI